MEHDVAQSAHVYKLWAWFETNKKQVLVSTAIAVGVGFVVSFYFWYQGEREVKAGEALSNALAPLALSGSARTEASEPFLKVAAEHPGTSAGGRALLFAAANLFAEGKYDAAQAQFQRFLRDYAQSPFLSQALLGVAACYDAQGKSNEAVTAYKELIDHHPTENAVPQAKFALARIYEAQNKIGQALSLYDELGRTYGSVGSEAGMRAEELKLKYPNAVAASSPLPLTAPGVPGAATNKP